MSGVNRQGQAHIVSTAIQSPGSGTGVEATPWFRTWFPIDPQPASISPTINISIVFICAFLVDHGRIICHPAIKNDSSAILRFFEIALVLARLDHGVSGNVKHGQLLVAPRNDIENVMKEELVMLLLPRCSACAECGMTTLEVTLTCLDIQLLCYLAFKVAEAIGV